jgi:hypothetical protein
VPDREELLDQQLAIEPLKRAVSCLVKKVLQSQEEVVETDGVRTKA